MDIRVFNTYGDTFQACAPGQIEAVFAGDVRVVCRKQGRFTMAVTGLFSGSPAAFATSDTRLADAVVAAMARWWRTGTYKKMMDFYRRGADLQVERIRREDQLLSTRRRDLRRGEEHQAVARNDGKRADVGLTR